MGIKQEVFVNLFQQYTDHYTQWFSPSTDSYATLVTSLPLVASENVSTDHKADMAVLGAIVAMFLICGISTAPLDPLLLHFSPMTVTFKSFIPLFLLNGILRERKLFNAGLTWAQMGIQHPFKSILRAITIYR